MMRCVIKGLYCTLYQIRKEPSGGADRSIIQVFFRSLKIIYKIKKKKMSYSAMEYKFQVFQGTSLLAYYRHQASRYDDTILN